MLKRTSKIFSSDADRSIEVTIKVETKRFNTSDGTREASDNLRVIEDEITAAVFTPRFNSRFIQFSGQQS